MNKLEEVKKYIETKQKGSVLWPIQESISGLNALRQDIWLEKISIWEKLNNWLWNDKFLLEYAKNYLELEKTKSDFWMQILELKLSLTYSYFIDFKQFLSDLKEAGESESAMDSETSNNIESTESLSANFMWTPIFQIKSSPFYRSSTSKVTWCAATARFNAYNFWFDDFPRGDAYKVWTSPWDWALDTIPLSKKNDKPSNKWPNIFFDEFININSNDKANFADIYTDSRTTYWHRVVGFKASDGQWYVLDPYNNVNGLNDKPKKLQDYMAKKWIKKVHFYQSKWYEYKSYSYEKD